MVDDRFGSLADAMRHIVSISRDRAVQERMLVRAVMMYPKLLLDLFDVRHDEVVSRCGKYVDRWQQQPQQPEERRERILRIASPAKAQRKKEARTRDAKAQLVRDLVQNAPPGADPVAATRVARQMIDTSLALAEREFDERITANVDVRWGDLTLRHLGQLEVNVEFLAELRECMRELAHRLPNDTTPLREVLPPDEMRTIKERCKARRDAAIHAVEAMRIARG